MKILKIIALSVSIFAITGFGLKEWGIPKAFADWNLRRLRTEYAEKQAEADKTRWAQERRERLKAGIGYPVTPEEIENLKKDKAEMNKVEMNNMYKPAPKTTIEMTWSQFKKRQNHG